MSMLRASEMRKPRRPSRQGQGVVRGDARAALGDEGSELHAVQPEGGRLGVDLGPANVFGRGGLHRAVDHSEAVEAGNRRQPTADGGSGEAPLFHGAGVQLDVAPLGGEDLEVVLGAPGEVLAQVAGVAGPRTARVAGQEAGDGQAGVVEERSGRSDDWSSCRWTWSSSIPLGGLHCASTGHPSARPRDGKRAPAVRSGRPGSAPSSDTARVAHGATDHLRHLPLG